MNLHVVFRIILVATCVVSLASVATLAGEGSSMQRTALRTVEGTVVAVYSQPAEGELKVVGVAVDTGAKEAGHFDLLLAPQQVLDEISFALDVGDRFRARVFVAEQGPLKVYKAMNLTKGTMVRFRSLHQVPLWGNAGDWEGGDCRRQGGQGGQGGRHGGGHRHGSGPKR